MSVWSTLTFDDSKVSREAIESVIDAVVEQNHVRIDGRSSNTHAFGVKWAEKKSRRGRGSDEYDERPSTAVRLPYTRLKRFHFVVGWFWKEQVECPERMMQVIENDTTPKNKTIKLLELHPEKFNEPDWKRGKESYHSKIWSDNSCKWASVVKEWNYDDSDDRRRWFSDKQTEIKEECGLFPIKR